jgi:hypothetical protein
MRISINRNIFALSFITVILAAVLVSCGTTPSPSSSPTPLPEVGFEVRQNTYMDILREKGYEPSIDREGEIQFTAQGDDYFIVVDRSDPSFVFLLLPASWYVDSDEAWQLFLIAIGNANRTTPVAKAYLIASDAGWEYMFIAAELFLENPNDFRVVFPYMIDAVNIVWEKLIDELT